MLLKWSAVLRIQQCRMLPKIQKVGPTVTLAMPIQCLYTLCLKKVSPLTFDDNFGKRGPICKILSPLDL